MIEPSPRDHESLTLLLDGSVNLMTEHLITSLPDDAQPVRGRTRQGITIELRRLSRRAGVSRTITGAAMIELTGGVEIAARVPACAYDPYPAYSSGRLPPGWTLDQLRKRTHYAIENALAHAELRRRRDGLFQMIVHMEATTPSTAPHLTLAMAEEEAVTGRHSDIHEMDEIDIAYWHAWLSVWYNLHSS